MRSIGWLGAASVTVVAGTLLQVAGCSSSYQTEAEGFGGAAGAAGAFGLPFGSDGLGGAGGEHSSGSPASLCDPDAVDDPDLEFLDENCDGIDGDEKRALFVSPLGSDEDAGTRAAPLATLTRALELAKKGGLDVYVCSATYEESLVIDGAGARIFGGFACEEGWARTTRPAELAPSEGIPLTIRHVSAPVRIDKVSFMAPAATLPSQSAIAAVIVDGADVALTHVELSAGAGAAGSDGAPAEEFTSGAVNGVPGNDAPKSTCRGSNGATLAVCLNVVQPWTCASSICTATCETDGGEQLTVSRLHGGAGGNGYQDVERKLGNTVETQSQPKPGAQANPGQGGAHGKAGATGFGEVTLDGVYHPSNGGTDGKYGKLGKHGAGGAGGPAWQPGDLFLPILSGSGGSGGMPGCGGRLGRGGGAGGASIALVSVNSNVALEHVDLRTSAGGAGGAATLGGAGQKGGQGGPGGLSQNGQRSAENGTAGGDGGKGGDGGPGAGGPSVGIVSIGPEPSRKATVFDTGIGGRGGRPGLGSTVGSGANGLSEDMYAIEVASEG